MQYLLRRLVLTIPVLFGVSLVVFTIMHVIPGDPVQPVPPSLRVQRFVRVPLLFAAEGVCFIPCHRLKPCEELSLRREVRSVCMEIEK